MFLLATNHKSNAVVLFLLPALLLSLLSCDLSLLPFFLALFSSSWLPEASKRLEYLGEEIGFWRKRNFWEILLPSTGQNALMRRNQVKWQKRRGEETQVNNQETMARFWLCFGL